MNTKQFAQKMVHEFQNESVNKNITDYSNITDRVFLFIQNKYRKEYNTVIISFRKRYLNITIAKEVKSNYHLENVKLPSGKFKRSRSDQNNEIMKTYTQFTK